MNNVQHIELLQLWQVVQGHFVLDFSKEKEAHMLKQKELTQTQELAWKPKGLV